MKRPAKIDAILYMLDIKDMVAVVAYIQKLEDDLETANINLAQLRKLNAIDPNRLQMECLLAQD